LGAKLSTEVMDLVKLWQVNTERDNRIGKEAARKELHDLIHDAKKEVHHLVHGKQPEAKNSKDDQVIDFANSPDIYKIIMKQGPSGSQAGSGG